MECWIYLTGSMLFSSLKLRDQNMAYINNTVWRKESLQTGISPNGGLTSTCHFHMVRDQSASAGSKMTCQKLNHVRGEEKWSIPQTVCSAVIKHCSLNTYTLFAIVIPWSRSKFTVKPHADRKKGIQNVLEDEFSLLLMCKFFPLWKNKF